MIRGIMMREVPVSELDLRPAPPPPEEPHEPKSPESQPAETTVLKKTYVRKKKKEEPDGYAAKFLVNDRNKHRVSTTISRELYDRIKKFLPMIAPDVPMTAYLNNIIADHFERYWDDISDLYNNELEKPL